MKELTRENLAVGDGHEIHVRSYGNPGGIPALFLHGGPGSGVQESQLGIFDPSRFHVIAFDQRGAGLSRFDARFHANTTPHLVADIERIRKRFGIERWMGGLIVAILVFIVIIGGIKSIGNVAEKVVPFMAATYIAMALIALILNVQDLPETFGRIFGGAFNMQSASGGFAGAMIIIAIRAGVARGLFSNEAGQGSTAIAHAVAQTNDPEQQGRMAMLGTFIDTIVICTMTALVILTVEGDFTYQGQAVQHVWQSDLGTTQMSGFVTTSGAFAAAFPTLIAGIPLGTLVASVALILFVFTTLLTWSYYGERAITFLYDRIPGSTRGGEKILHIIWRVIWCIGIFVGATQPSQLVWRLGDISNAAMALPNLLALALLSGVVFKLAKGERDAGPTHTEDTPEEPEEY